MKVKSKVSENSILLIAIGVISVGLIFTMSYLLSQREVKTDVKTLAKQALVMVPDVKEPTPLEIIWKKKSIIPSIKKLDAPFKKFDLQKSFTLNWKKKTFKNKFIEISINVTEKNYKVGNNDSFLVELEISNPTKKWLVFRVVTEKNNSMVTCHSMKINRVHGFLLEPGSSIKRFEGCTFSRKAAYLKISIVQSLLMPEAGFITMSRVGIPFGLTRRLEKSHKSLSSIRLSPCPLYAQKDDVNKKIAADSEAWFKTMNFLARHDCSKEKLQ
jgi:hypothetical protein